MTIHYHGTPISPIESLYRLAGCHFCVSFAAPQDIKRCHEIGQSVMLDNGAYSFWTTGKEVKWDDYYKWCEKWLKFQTTWAVIPDVIDGDAEDNETLLLKWPFGSRGAPVWHLHEPIARLLALARKWPRVCIGSSGEYSQPNSLPWHQRMTQAMNQLCGDGPAPCWLHMLRGLRLSGTPYPFASVDSANIGRNHGSSGKCPALMAEQWDRLQNPAEWKIVSSKQLTLLETHGEHWDDL